MDWTEQSGDGAKRVNTSLEARRRAIVEPHQGRLAFLQPVHQRLPVSECTVFLAQYRTRMEGTQEGSYWDIPVIMNVCGEEIFQVNGGHFWICDLTVLWTRGCRKDLICLLGEERNQ